MTVPPRKGHDAQDHVYGVDLAHTHDGEADHDHDFPDELPAEDNPIWLQDHVFLTSVGIDVGSSGTQIIFSRLELRRRAEDLSSRFYVVSRDTVFESPVSLTPYQNESRIDENALGLIIGEAYAAAGMRPGAIDSGVVILTGEALRRDNSAAIARIVAEAGGDFVCATAGHHMEARLAAFGSLAARRSLDENKRILNIDIGGGTTKLAVVEHGSVVATAAIHIGGRLQVVTRGTLTRLDPAGKHHARRAGLEWSLGDAVADRDLDRVAGAMADALVAALLPAPPHDIAHLYLTDPIADLGRIDGVMFSGGVAEYVYGRETRDFGDLGRRLGHAIRARLDAGALPWPLLPAGQCIRATALGASEYSVQLSGNTSMISNPGVLLPRRNLRALHPEFVAADVIDSGALARAIGAHLVEFDVPDDEEFVLALGWRGAPEYARIAACARGIRDGLARRIAAGHKLYVMLDGDIARTLGTILRAELGVANEMLVIDGVALADFDYVDLGRLRLPSQTVPVTIKSLVFNEDPRGARGRHRIHHHDHDHDHHHDDGHHHHHGHG